MSVADKNIANAYVGKIHLLMTDVVMPEMNGRDLTEKITAVFPEIKLLFMFGYAANIITQQGGGWMILRA